MKVGVVHDSLNFAGGAERVCLKTIEALQENDHQVILGTIEPTNWDHLRSVLGNSIRPNEETHLFGIKIGMLRSYLDLFLPILARKMRRACQFCINTNADTIPTKSEVSYLHYVPSAVAKGEFARADLSVSRIHSMPHRLLQLRSMDNLQKSNLITNSLFSQRAIKQCLGLDSSVVNPPVELNKFFAVSGSTKSNLVATTGRMSPERRFEIILSVASEMPDVNFAIVGHQAGALSQFYYDKLCDIRNKMRLHNVSIVLNDSFERMRSLFASSKIFLHTMHNEALGLSVVEAMASGLVPLVTRSGGPWEDILEKKEGIYGFTYSNIEEAVRAIRFLLSQNEIYFNIVTRNVSKVRSFSDLHFKVKLIQIVNNVLRKYRET